MAPETLLGESGKHVRCQMPYRESAIINDVLLDAFDEVLPYDTAFESVGVVLH